MLKVDPEEGRAGDHDGIRTRSRTTPRRRATDADAPARDAGTSPAGRGAERGPRQVKPGHRLLGIPLRTVAAVELALGAALVAMYADDPLARLVGWVVVALALLAAPASGGAWFLTPALRRALFGVRRHAASARTADDEDAPAGVDRVEEGVRSLFPGLELHSATNRAGLHFGVASWGEHRIAALEIEQRAAASASTSMPVPLEAVVQRCREAEIPLTSLALLRTVRSGRADEESDALRSIQGELAERGEFSRSRTYLVMRLAPRRAAAAVAVRGGGQQGEDAALASLLARSASVMAAAGLVGRQLSVGDLREVLEDSLFPGRVGPDEDQPATWVERWDAITNPSHRHLVMTASSWRSGAGIVAMSPREVTDLDLALEVLDPVDQPLARVTVRITAPSGSSTRSLRKSLAKAASGLGVGLHTLGGGQAAGLRSTTLIGEGH